MSKFLANENIPADAVQAVREAGYDIAWIRELSPGAADEAVLRSSLSEQRI